MGVLGGVMAEEDPGMVGEGSRNNIDLFKDLSHGSR